MKIISITTVKNEADIIESFVRYHLNIVDEMIILNNGSTDDTKYILNQLVHENLPLIVIEDTDKYFKPFQKMNCLLKKAIYEYGADIVCPIDVDEFISSDFGNPRDIIEKLDKFTYFKIKWRTYVPSINDDANEKFIPSRITTVRDENLEEYKVIVHKTLFTEFNIKLSVGSHKLYFDERYKSQINCQICDKLVLSHFPLRSKEQTISKVLVSYPNLLCRTEVDPNIGFHKSHYAPMFFKIKKEGSISDEDIMEFAKRYSLKGNEVDENYEIITNNIPMNIDFCEKLNIKYSYNPNPISDVLNHYIYLAKEINRLKKYELDMENRCKIYTDRIHDLLIKHNEDRLNIDELTSKLSDFVNNDYIEDNNSLLDINYLNNELSNCKMEIISLKNQLDMLIKF